MQRNFNKRQHEHWMPENRPCLITEAGAAKEIPHPACSDTLGGAGAIGTGTW